MYTDEVYVYLVGKEIRIGEDALHDRARLAAIATMTAAMWRWNTGEPCM